MTTGFLGAKGVFIVAEVGNNHEGSLADALALVDAAAKAHVDAIKFQTFTAANFVRPADAKRMEQMRRFELPAHAWGQLRDRAKSHGLLFVSTPLDVPSVEVLAPLVDAYKVASGDITFAPLIDAIAAKRRPTILSTGASTMPDVDAAVARIRGKAPQLGLLHCVSSYPTPDEQANLRAIQSLQQRFPDAVAGYSDHTQGLDASVAAVAVGARIVEKHFTLDRNRSAFRDHQLSADPAGMAELVRRIRATEAMLGDGVKRAQPCEEAMIPLIRRSIVAARDLPAGHVVTRTDLTWKRPATGVAPGEEDRVLGRLAAAVPAGVDVPASAAHAKSPGAQPKGA